MAGETDRETCPFVPYLARIHARLLAGDAAPAWQEVDGTLVFADVSGFTPLTEKLATRGKIGAEELTDVLNTVFGTLLEHADDFGGDLLKFGGDALLLLFTGAEHPQRACAAALGMQRALGPFRKLRTAGGKVSLRMSVGVSSGPILLFAVGDSHSELLVSGPTMSRVVELESAADATEVLVGAGTAAAIDPELLASGDSKAGGLLLRKSVRLPPPTTLPPGGSAPRCSRTRARSCPVCRLGSEDQGGDRGDAVDPGAGIPVGLRDHLTHRHEGGEHRVAVLTFLQFKGVDALLDAQGPPVVARALHQLIAATQASCERHGVRFLATDLDKDGGKVLLVAGAPTASEDDADRTLACVLDILEAAPPELAVRAGVNRGRAFAVDVGNAQRRTYAVMGDPTNLAARVMGRAEPGGLVATAAVLQQAQCRYDLEPLPSFLVKGKSLPINASVVRRVVDRAARDLGRRTELVGRERERQALQAVVDAARRGEGGVIELVADPGMGKSRLVQELLAAAGDLPTLTVEGAAYASSSPYLVLRNALRKAFSGGETGLGDLEILRRAVPRFAPHREPYLPLLGLLFGLELEDTPETAALDPAFRRSRLHRFVGELLEGALPDAGVLVIEDSQWLDEATGELLTGIAATASTRGWAWCVTRRPSDSHLRLPADATSIALEPLPAEAVRALLGGSLTVALPPAALARLVERSGGNPLFMQELIAAVERGDDIDALPDTVEALIAARIDTLSPTDRLLLRQASVLGARFTLDVLAKVIGLPEPEVAASLDRLGGFLDVDGTGYRFRHALVREAAYEGLSYRLRRRLHGQAGEIVEAGAGDDLEEWSDLLSLHFTQAGDIRRSWRYSCLAGERARRTFAPVDAVAFYRRAVDAATQLPDVPQEDLGGVLETLGECSEMAGQYEGAVKAYGRARKVLAHRPLRLAELHRKEGWVRERSGRYADALRWYTRGQRLLEAAEDALAVAVETSRLDAETLEPPQRLRARLALAAGAARLRQGRYRECLPLLHDAVSLAEPLGDRETLAHAYYLLDWAHTDLGNDERHHYRELSLPIYEELGNLARQGVVSSNLGIDAYFEGRWEEAVAWYRKGHEASGRAGDVVQMATATNNLGELESDRGHLDLARQLFAEAMQVWRTAPFPVGVALATSNLGRVAVRSGDLDRAKVLLDEARELFDDIGADSYVLETDAREVERLVAAGCAVEALALVADIDTRSQRAGGLPLLTLMTHRMAAYATAHLGRFDEALGQLTAVEARARELGAEFELALTLEAVERVLVAAGRNESEPYRTAVDDLFRRLGVASTPKIPLSPPFPSSSIEDRACPELVGGADC